MTSELANIAVLSSPDDDAAVAPVLEVSDLVQEFKVRRRGQVSAARVSAVAGISFAIERGTTFGIVGETGSGKSSLARAIIGAPPPVSGRVVVNGEELCGDNHGARRERGRHVQMIFQDPTGALDPKWTVERIVGEPLAIQGERDRGVRRDRARDLLGLVGLDPDRFSRRRASELSGGQAQRVAIARALIASPDLVICDEPVTALDVSVQAQIVRLLRELKRTQLLTYLLIAHDLSVVRSLADTVATMYLGKFCEVGGTAEIFENPAHPYTSALLSAIPTPPGTPTRPRIRLLGEPPSPFAPPSGCRFRTRCAFAEDVCTTVEPPLRVVAAGHAVACHFPFASATSTGRRATAEVTT